MRFIFFVFAICIFSHELVGISPSLAQERACDAIVFQPQFRWKNSTYTQQGTGCFIKAPNGKLIGLTCAHFIDFSGPPLLQVDWLDIRTEKPIAISVKSWGMPGRGGDYTSLDFRSDYLFLLMEGDIGSQSILELESSPLMSVGERVLFPNKDPEMPQGYELIEGAISEARTTHLIVKLDRKINYQSRSGTPILSQSTKKIIGILAGGDNKGNKTLLYLVPSFAIQKALLAAQQSFLLLDVVGKK